MSGRVFLLGVGMALVALAFALTNWAVSLVPGVTLANARRIRPGMTRAAVESLLGGSGIEFRVPPFIAPDPTYEWCWLGKGFAVAVRFNEGDRVEYVAVDMLRAQDPTPFARALFGLPAQDATPFARLRAWLGW
jgi:hypothetical protein